MSLAEINDGLFRLPRGRRRNDLEARLRTFFARAFARAALLAVEGTASTNHGRVVETFERMVRKRKLGKVAAELAGVLKKAYELRADADYDTVDLTEQGRQLRERVLPFLALCRAQVEAASEHA